ncbi:MAG TPA: hypothetical protein VFC39_06540 [Acidobacteriaceae bacterium]|nr:hypothetical protein [Acidobacteriaceae bacterium]
MTQLTISDELASAIASKAADWTCSTEDLLQSMLFKLESDEAFAERLSTPALGKRIRADLARVDQGEYLTEEQVDSKFDEIFRELESR